MLHIIHIISHLAFLTKKKSTSYCSEIKEIPHLIYCGHCGVLSQVLVIEICTGPMEVEPRTEAISELTEPHCNCCQKTPDPYRPTS